MKMNGYFCFGRCNLFRSEGRITSFILFLVSLLIFNSVPKIDALESFYSNVTLTANDGDLSVVVYLPAGIKPGEREYYVSTRFDWSSMIGSITRTTTNPLGEKETHSLYGTRQWRLPHDPYWPESGVGLASEFGVGDDGSLCSFLCGWNQTNEVTNGVLGYQEAKSGESFLKIGVGELIKGSCSTCDSAEDYKFNSPYRFATLPVWKLDDAGDGKSITLSHEATVRNYGYRLQKQITLHDDQLLVKTTIKNTGTASFSTAWYSHHFFTCDIHPVEYGYSVDYDLANTDGDYREPGTWSWSTPLKKYATIRKLDDDAVRIEMERGVESNVKIKAEFVKDKQSRGVFTLQACNTKIKESIPEIADPNSDISMYGFNLYIESGTFSPEPQILLQLLPGKSTSWTQQLDFQDNYPPLPSATPQISVVPPSLSSLLRSKTDPFHRGHSSGGTVTDQQFEQVSPAYFLNFLIIGLSMSFVATTVISVYRYFSCNHKRKLNYLPVPDHYNGDMS